MLPKNLLELPSVEDLPESDGKPVDSQLQALICSSLDALLTMIWGERRDWFFGVNIGLYYLDKDNLIVPDGFLSLGVERYKGANGRLSYATWEENYVIPLLAVECVSKNYGGEYDLQEKKGKDYAPKMREYAQMGIKYYAIYNPVHYSRDKHQPFEVYKLEGDSYVLQEEEPLWIEEIGLALGRGMGTFRGWNREWLYWYDWENTKYLASEELLEEERRNS